jgi:hypothetical protein
VFRSVPNPPPVVKVAASEQPSSPPVRIIAALSVPVAALAVQLVGLRPNLTRRTDLVLAGLNVPRSRSHYIYVGAEAVKVVALLVAGILLLRS